MDKSLFVYLRTCHGNKKMILPYRQLLYEVSTILKDL